MASNGVCVGVIRNGVRIYGLRRPILHVGLDYGGIQRRRHDVDDSDVLDVAKTMSGEQDSKWFTSERLSLLGTAVATVLAIVGTVFYLNSPEELAGLNIVIFAVMWFAVGFVLRRELKHV